MKTIHTVFLLLMISTPSFASGELLAVRGNVTVNNVAASAKAKLSEGDVIETAAQSLAVIRWDNRSIFKLEENSSLRLTAQQETFLEDGSVMVQVKKLLKGQKSISLKTKSTALAVRGTTFYAIYGKKGEVWTCVREGQVAVKGSTESDFKLVNAGEGVVTTNGQHTSTPKPVEWTKNLNWKMTPEEGNITPSVKIKDLISDPKKSYQD